MKAPRFKKLPMYYEGKEAREMAKGGEVKHEPYTPDERPTINFDSTELPELRSWKVGESYPILMHVKQMSVHTIEHGNKKGKIEATFKVEKVAYCPDEGEEEDDTDVEDGYKKGGTVSPEKAKQILHDGTIRGHKITNKQRKFFGAKSNAKANGGFTIHNAMTGLPIEEMPKNKK